MVPAHISAHTTGRYLLLSLLIGLLAGLCPPGALPPARAATSITVPCDVTALRDAISSANSEVAPYDGADTLELAAGCTYTLPDSVDPIEGGNGLPSVTSVITINGNGATIERV